MFPPFDEEQPLSALQRVIPPELLNFLHATAFHPRSPVQIFLSNAFAAARQIINTAVVLSAPYLDAAIAYLGRSPEIVSLVAILLVLYVVLTIMAWLRRLMMFFTRLAIRAVFWAFVFAGVAFVARNGVLETTREVVYIGGRMLGFMAVLKDVFTGQLRRYEEEARLHRQGH